MKNTIYFFSKTQSISTVSLFLFCFLIPLYIVMMLSSINRLIWKVFSKNNSTVFLCWPNFIRPHNLLWEQFPQWALWKGHWLITIVNMEKSSDFQRTSMTVMFTKCLLKPSFQNRCFEMTKNHILRSRVIVIAFLCIAMGIITKSETITIKKNTWYFK